MTKPKKGFTIIEVVLVLAIAGLIFLMIFVALPALQRSQRDNARKNDVAIVLGAVTSFIGNNRGILPTSIDANNNGYSDQIEPYVKSLSSNTTSVKVNTSNGGGQPFTISIADGNYNEGEIIITKTSYCGGGNGGQVIYGGRVQQFSVTTKLESGNALYYCQNN